MSVPNYEYFVRIVETGSLTKAAEKLYISQPSLSTTANFLKAWSFYGPDRHYDSCVCGNIQSLSYS